ncbi:MAG: twin-arginine translocase TatA/TatE family subunit [Crocinitomicaceae bacterium]|nr:twin-arginine translocase TatA/TatE family subunit [Flavobacteriales bacterium]NQZ35510.1 twin-arginine translocase TatA/TatE family subunit [Crocinitomicaceae bacterium]
MVLFLNDIGTSEVVLILVFILIFFGSKSIPGLARTLGRTIRQVKDASNDLQSEIRKSSNELKAGLNLKELIDDTARDIQRPLDQYAADIEDVIKRTPINSMPKQRAVEATPPVASTTDTPEISEAPKVTKAPKEPNVPKVEPIKPPSPKIEPTKDSK